MSRQSRSYFQVLKNLVLLSALIAASSVTLLAQSPANEVLNKKQLPPAVERMLSETNIASLGHYHSVSNSWREVFVNARNRENLKEFVGKSVDVAEKFQQVYDIAVNPGATEARITTLFRSSIMDSDAICRSMEKSLSEYCQSLDDQDQALFIKLKIDRQAGRTMLARSIIDPATFKEPINAVTASTVKSVQNDLSRGIISGVASYAIGSVAKQTVRDMGLNTSKEGSVADFMIGLFVEMAVDEVVDQVTDPKPAMVSNLVAHLQNAERAILDGNGNSPGFLTVLRRITDERITARRKLIEAEYSK